MEHKNKTLTLSKWQNKPHTILSHDAVQCEINFQALIVDSTGVRVYEELEVACMH